MDDWKIDVILILVGVGGLSQVYLLIKFLELARQVEGYIKSGAPKA